MGKERLLYVDIAKGIGILLVVWGHIGNWGCIAPLYRLISYFHVPIFFMLSGFFFPSKPNYKDFFISKIRRLLKPYYIGGGISFLLGVYMFQTNEITDFFDFVIGGRTVGPLWFLTSLFCSMVIFYSIVNHHQCLKIVFSAICLIISYFLFRHHVYLPLNMDMSLMMIPFLYLGNEIRKVHFTREQMIGVCWIAFLGLFSCFVYDCIHDTDVTNYYNQTIGIFPMVVFSAFCGSLCVYSSAYLIAESNIKVVKKYLSYIGQNTLVILIFHQTIFKRFLISLNFSPEGVLGSTVLFFSIVLLCHLAIPLVNKYGSFIVK